MKIENFLKENGLWSNLFKSESETQDIEIILKSIPPFGNLSGKYIKALTQIIHYRKYNCGEIIFYKGDPGIGFYIIREGEIEIHDEDEGKESFLLAKLGRGDFFGEIALLEDRHRSATAKVIKESQLAVIFKPDLDDFMDRFPKAGVSILRGISQIVIKRLAKLDQDYISLLESIKEKEDA